jgi:hypothetical protein
MFSGKRRLLRFAGDRTARVCSDESFFTFKNVFPAVPHFVALNAVAYCYASDALIVVLSAGKRQRKHKQGNGRGGNDLSSHTAGILGFTIARTV